MKYILSLIIKPLIFVLLLSLLGCSKQPTATFFISNGSEDQPEVPLIVIINKDTIFNQAAKFTDIAPDNQYSRRLELKPGEHRIRFEVADTNLKETASISAFKNQWIFLTYTYRAPADSLERIEFDKRLKDVPNKDSIFAAFYEGTKPTLLIHVIDSVDADIIELH